MKYPIAALIKLISHLIPVLERVGCQTVNTAPGDIRFSDHNGDDVIDEDDRQFSLFDLAGRLLWEQESVKSTAIAKYDFPLELPSGMYLLSVKMGEVHEWSKVLIGH